jgi:hypothetical protein
LPRAGGVVYIGGILAVIVIVAVLLVLAAGFWLTRGSGGPMDAEGRAVDAKAQISPMGKPMSFDDDLKPPRP